MLKTKTERVANAAKKKFNGFVYNATTASGNYFANGVLVHNSGGLGTPAYARVEAGAVHKANKGVLFIDEVSSLSPKAQQELLTAMQEKKYSITGQSEMSSGAMVRTMPVPCLPKESLLCVEGKNVEIGKFCDVLFESNKNTRVGEQEVLFVPKVQARVLAKAEQNNCFEAPLLLYRRRYKGKLVKIAFDDGSEVKLTPEHPVLTTNGFEKAERVSEGQAVVSAEADSSEVVSFDDVLATYDKETQRVSKAFVAFKRLEKNLATGELCELLGVDRKTVSSWRRGAVPRAVKCVKWLSERNLLPFHARNDKAERIAKLAGALFGDGGITRNFKRVFFVTPIEANEDANDFASDIASAFDLKKDEIKIRVKTGKAKGLEVSLNNAFASRFFKTVGVPAGDKVSQKFTVPKWVHENTKTEKAFFGALIACEMYGSIKKISDGIKFSMNKITSLEENHLCFLGEIKSFLEKNRVGTRAVVSQKAYVKNKAMHGKPTQAKGYGFRFATKHEDLLALLAAVELPYAKAKLTALKRVSTASVRFIKRKRELGEAYEQIPALRSGGKTIREIANELSLAKNTVLKKVPLTNRRYSEEFKNQVVAECADTSIKDVATRYEMPTTTAAYWLKQSK